MINLEEEDPEIFERVGGTRVESHAACLAPNILRRRVGEAKQRRVEGLIHLRFAENDLEMALLYRERRFQLKVSLAVEDGHGNAAQNRR